MNEEAVLNIEHRLFVLYKRYFTRYVEKPLRKDGLPAQGILAVKGPIRRIIFPLPKRIFCF